MRRKHPLPVALVAVLVAGLCLVLSAPEAAEAADAAETAKAAKAAKSAKGKHRAKRPATKVAAKPERDVAASGYERRPEVRAFVDDLATRHGLSADALLRTFKEVRNLPSVARLMVPATSSQPPSWSAYRKRFIEPQRIAAGVRFWTEHAELLARAERVYGVPAEIIVGITGVETIYGRNTGSYRVIDALATLAFDYPKDAPRDRSPFFRAQLEDYLLFVREQRLDAFEVRGSYAGAIGIPQFMPGSYRRFAVDFDGDGAIDLRANTADVIGSVANFLREHGWVPGATIYHPVTLPVGLRAEDLQRLIDAGADPTITGATLRALSFELPVALGDTDKFALINLPNPQAPGESAAPTEYVLGTRNFLALTRYNRSYFYAMAVAGLGAAVRAQLPEAVPR